MKKKELLVVPTTHWDRAWYWPFERFRVKLADMFQGALDQLKKHPDYTFTLDGQTIPLEDYLEIRPDTEETLRQYGRQGRFKSGPLYVLSDLYCTGGEALIRNLLIGMAHAAEFSSAQTMTLYLPDTFGITPSIPMIASGFGIPVFSFMRGTPGAVPEQQRMFIWDTPDGSSVRVFRLRDGYANAARLGIDPDFKCIIPRIVAKYGIDKLADAALKQLDGQGSPYLLLAGVDHQIPQKELHGYMKAVNRKYPFSLKYGTLDSLAEQMIRRRETSFSRYKGEFHGTGSGSVLGGTVSSRIYLKQQNAEAERDLVFVSEPAEALSVLTGSRPVHGKVLETAWKHLLKVHPHDNITGCSVDLVHREDESNIIKARIAADAVRRKMIRNIAETFGGQKPGDKRYGFFLINNQAVSRRIRFTVQCDFEGRMTWGDTKPPARYRVVDDKGRLVPFREIERSRSVEHPHPVLFIEVFPLLKPFSIERFFLEPAQTMPLTPPLRNTIENTRLKVRADKDGTVDIFDKKIGKWFRKAGGFSSQQDMGDTYNYVSVPGEEERVGIQKRIRISDGKGCSGLQVLNISGKLQVKNYKTGKGFIPLPFTMQVSLSPDSPHADFRIEFENTAPDHRLRFNIPIPFSPDQTEAGLKFNTARRKARSSKPPKNNTAWVEPIHPADHYVSADNGAYGIALFSEFPFNYECVTERNRRIAATVLRATGFLSRTGAGPNTRTPEAQCFRAFTMNFALRPFSRNEKDRLFSEALFWRTPPVHGLIEGYDKPVQGLYEGPFFRITPSHLAVSACKLSQKGRDVILRIFNPSSRTCKAKLRAPEAGMLVPCGLDEKKGGKGLKPDRTGSVFFSMSPFSLKTFAVKKRKRKN